MCFSALTCMVENSEVIYTFVKANMMLLHLQSLLILVFYSLFYILNFRNHPTIYLCTTMSQKSINTVCSGGKVLYFIKKYQVPSSFAKHLMAAKKNQGIITVLVFVPPLPYPFRVCHSISFY